MDMQIYKRIEDDDECTFFFISKSQIVEKNDKTSCAHLKGKV
jgi:hypothetical protein